MAFWQNYRNPIKNQEMSDNFLLLMLQFGIFILGKHNICEEKKTANRTYLKTLLAIPMSLLMMASATVAGAIIYVDDDGPADFNNIQAAIDHANDGDVVIVAEGRYFELINLKAKDVTLRSREPNNLDVVVETIIDGGAGSSVAVLDNSGVRFNPRVVTFNSGEGPDCVLNGLTITNGRSGGVYCADSSPTLVRCAITRNRARAGAGMYNKDSSASLVDCSFVKNVGSAAGGVYNHNSNPTLKKCTFIENQATWWGGGMVNAQGSRPMVINCIFANNSAEGSGGAIGTGGDNSAGILRNCTLVGNSAGGGAGGIYHGSAFGRLKVINCILWGNRDRGKIVAMAQIRNSSTAGAVINYSCIEGLDVPDVPEVLLCGPYGSGTGNIGKDPLFADPNKGDYHLRSKVGRWHPKRHSWIHDGVTSPCIDAGDPNYIAEPNETDLDGKPRVIGGRIDMGAYESPVPAEVRIVPRNINLASEGKWITCYIWLPEDYNFADINPNSVVLEGEIEAESFSVDEQEQVAIAKFSRSEVQDILSVGQAELTITGELTDGTIFEATDVIRVIDKGQKSAK